MPQLDVLTGTKICAKCRKSQPPENFSKDAARRDQLFLYCRSCEGVRLARHYQKQIATPEGRSARRRNAWVRLMQSRGMSAKQYEDMLADQGGTCAICHRAETFIGRGGSVRPLSVDHDHETGVIRGLLCHACNMAIGLAGEDPERLEEAANYLRRHTCPPQRT